MKFKLTMIVLQFVFLQSCIIQTLSHNNALESKIKSTMEKTNCKAGIGNTTLDFKSLTNFEWERLYIVGPFNNLSQLQKTAKIDLSQVKDDKIRFGKTNNFILAFTKNKKLTAVLKFPRIGDFTNIINLESGYSPEDAVFNVCERGDSTFLGERIFKIDKYNTAITVNCPEEEIAEEN